MYLLLIFFFQAEDGIRDYKVTGVQTCALPIFAALERGGRRVTLEAGGMRVTVPVEDLEPSSPGRGGRAGGDGGEDDGRSTIGSIGLERARSVASSLDLRGARVDEALEALRHYLDDA